MEAQVIALENRLADLCGHLNVLHSKLVEMVAQALRDDLWAQAGIRSPEHWLAWKTGVSLGRARQLVTMARRRDELPATFQAFDDGELSVDQVAVVAAHARAAHDQEVCEIAKCATVSQLRHALSRYRHDDPPAPSEKPAPSQQPAPSELPHDSVSLCFGDDGRFHMSADLGAELGAIVANAMREARDHLFRTSKPGVTWADALLEVCSRSLNGVNSTSRRDRYKVYIHVDTEGAWLQSGPALPPSVVDRILCDGVVHPVWETQGQPANVGRAKYTFPDHIRRLILDRDRTCRAPGCASTVGLEVHHIIHWRNGGETSSANGVALCPHDHDRHHAGEFSLSGNADLPGGLVFTDRHGRMMPPGAMPNPPTGPPPAPPPGHRYAHPTGERFDMLWFHLDDRPTAAA